MQLLKHIQEYFLNNYQKLKQTFNSKNQLKNPFVVAFEEIKFVLQQIFFTVLISQIKIDIHQTCPICLTDNLQHQGVMSEQCKHSFCYQCIYEYWLHNQKRQLKCPCCRTKINTFAKSSKLLNIYSQECNKFIFEYRIRCTVLRQYIIYPFQILYNIYKQMGQLWNLIILLIKTIWQMWLIILLAILIFYVLSPIDLLPELYLGVFGLLDDIICICFICWIVIIQAIFRRQ